MTQKPDPNALLRFLRPPGNGVFTVHTAQDVISAVQRELYASTPDLEVESAWRNSLNELNTMTQVNLLGICHDNGGGIQRGANWGPLFVRRALLERVDARSFIDLGDIPVIPHLLHDKYLNQETLESCREALYKERSCDLPVSPLSIAEHLCDLLYQRPEASPILGLGGDHSVSYPLVRSWLKKKRAENKRVAIVHFDAHTDLMERRLGIDLCFATWAYHILDLLQSPRDLLQYGIRSSGKTQEYWESTLGIQQRWADELRLDTQPAAQQLNDYLITEEIEEVYVSFDIDAMDEQIASATGTPEPNGLEIHHVQELLNAIPKTCRVTGADLVEVAPWVKRTVQTESDAESDAESEAESEAVSSTSERFPETDLTLGTAGEICSILLQLLNESLTVY